ncbi:MAG: helix-turn-helix domain-containing protein [Lachnospira sp.]
MEQKNITQLELSRRTGIATSNISDWKKKKKQILRRIV